VPTCLVVISQPYRTSKIDSIRQGTLGGMVSEGVFLWTNHAYYSVGVAMGVIAESSINARMDRFTEA